MAWTDDRLWCHPKYVGLSWRAKAVLRHSFDYSSGMATHGHLDAGAQRLLGADRKTRDELIAGGWWDTNGTTDSVVVHDWEEHNGARDKSRQLARERKQRWKERHGTH